MVILLLCSLCLLEQAVLRGGDLDTQAFPASGAGEDGAQLAALDLLQYGLPGTPDAWARVRPAPARAHRADAHALTQP